MLIRGFRIPSYRDYILSERPLAFWRFDDAGATTLLRDIAGANRNGTYGATGVGYQKQNALPNDPTPSASFASASTGSAIAAIDLSPYPTITVECWLRWVDFSISQIICESAPNYVIDGGFLIFPNSSLIDVYINKTVGGTNHAHLNAAPTAGVWHLLTVVIDLAASTAAGTILIYCDGQLAPQTPASTTTYTGNFANQSITFMSRNQASLFADGNLANFAIYPRALSAAQVLAHYQAGVNPAYLPRLGLTLPPFHPTNWVVSQASKRASYY